MGNFLLLQFLCSCSNFNLNSKNIVPSFQFTFAAKKVEVRYLSFTLDSLNQKVCWTFEGSSENSTDATHWTILFKETQPQQYTKDFPVLKPIPDSDLYSSFRFSIQFQDSNPFRKHDFSLTNFELYGYLVFLDKISSLNSFKKLASVEHTTLLQSYYYQFQISEIRHSGLLHFLSTFPSSTILSYLTFVRSPTLDNSSILNLFNWNNSSWTSYNQPNCYFSFMFLKNSQFKIEGYRIRSSKLYFPTSWKVFGITEKKQEFLIDEVQYETSLCHEYAEKTFHVSEQSPFFGFKVIQIGNNFNGTYNFSLSAIEFFGILTTS